MYKETGMQKWADMLVETGKASVDTSDDDTNDIKMDNTTTRLITF